MLCTNGSSFNIHMSTLTASNLLTPSSLSTRLTILRCRGTSDNLEQFACDDGLTCSVEENLIFANHLAWSVEVSEMWSPDPIAKLTGVLAGVLHGIAAGRLLGRVTFGQSPVQAVGQRVLLEMRQRLIVNLVLRNLGCDLGVRIVSRCLLSNVSQFEKRSLKLILTYRWP